LISVSIHAAATTAILIAESPDSVQHGRMENSPTEAVLFIDDVEHPPSSFIDACKTVWSLGPAMRAKARIETPTWSYPADELESMRAEDEGEI
jgi:hypothetical protein